MKCESDYLTAWNLIFPKSESESYIWQFQLLSKAFSKHLSQLLPSLFVWTTGCNECFWGEAVWKRESLSPSHIHHVAFSTTEGFSYHLWVWPNRYKHLIWGIMGLLFCLESRRAGAHALVSSIIKYIDNNHIQAHIQIVHFHFIWSCLNVLATYQ